MASAQQPRPSFPRRRSSTEYDHPRRSSQVRHEDEEGIPISSDDRASSSGPPVTHSFVHGKSILALAVHGNTLYAGTQGGEILVYDLQTFERTHVLEAHHENDSVLGLCLTSSGSLLFSCGGDRFVDIWDTSTSELLLCLYSDYDIGDIFCLCWSPLLNTIYLGAQDGSLQWYNINDFTASSVVDKATHPYLRKDAFFSSRGPGGIPTPSRKPTNSPLESARNERGFLIPRANVKRFAHNGYINCMLLTDGGRVDPQHNEILITGAGDGLIKVWSLTEPDGHLKRSFHVCEEEDDGEPVLCLALAETFLYSGHADGMVQVWDLEAKQHLRSISTGQKDVLTLSISQGMLFAACAGGSATQFDQRCECVGHWSAHEDLILSSACTKLKEANVYITGGNDNTIKLWVIGSTSTANNHVPETTHEQLLDSLHYFVSIPTVSSDPRHQNDCRRAASYLRELLKKLGASTELLRTERDFNPVVFAHFSAGKKRPLDRKRIVFYGHYDVVPAANKRGLWRSDPFKLTGVDGHLYGRGVSDNKGPILAAIFAVADLFSQGRLTSDVVFLIEGEEEQGSRGFQNAIKGYKSMIGHVDWILLANSYWLDDEFPCLTYGLRGVLRATVSIASQEVDLHSGVDGSHMVDESMNDLVALMARLMGPGKRVRIPGFYDAIPAPTKAEMALYEELTASLLDRDPRLQHVSREDLTKSLMGRWREPTLTIHGFEASGPANPTIIPSSAQATFSMRLVPDQDVCVISESLRIFLDEEFANLSSKNEYTLRIDHTAEPWLGDTSNKLFKTLERAVMEVWSQHMPQGPDILSNEPGRDTANREKPGNSSGRHGARKPSITSNTLSKASSSPSKGAPRDSSNLGATRSQAAMRKPLYIREGGSIPAVRFLEKEFGAPAAHLPCGQASDKAHLDNERFRVLNLYKAKDVFTKVFERIGT